MNACDDGSGRNLDAEIDQIANRFASEFRSGTRPMIEHYLSLLPELRPRLLRALLRSEIELRRGVGEKPGKEEYVRRFPDDGRVIDAAITSHLRATTYQGEATGNWRSLPLSPYPSSSVGPVAFDVESREGDGESGKGTRADGHAAAADLDDTVPPTNAGLSTRATEPPSAGDFDAEEDAIPEWITHFRIEGVLGNGGFGRVYRAFDTQLSRPVAIKGPSLRHWQEQKRRLQEQFKAESVARIVDEFLDEARKAAGLKHPGIVVVYEFRVEADRPYIVQELIEGTELGQWALEQKPDHPAIVRAMIEIAEAISHAHQQGFVHRDLKPANILVDPQGHTHVTDFGLALHESMQLRHLGEFAGTLPYMSPEQVAGDAHRLDGRTDLWSLGVIFYELLVGRLPFVGAPRDLAQQIKLVEPRPPRQRNPAVPDELDRICLKLLQKSPRDRYASASALNDDLRQWLESSEVHGVTNPSGAGPDGAELHNRRARILPKGLRSFDTHDADFFLKLLPGPHDEQGIPEIIRFWKHRIEEPVADRTFTVGLICGPSGCGKSSLIKAGLLPRLDRQIVSVYVECTASGTEGRLFATIAARFPDLPKDISLPEMVQGLAAGRWLGHAGKLLIVLDQFEQWVHGKDREQISDLLKALQACDGRFVQCLLLVRDDFWVGTNRLMEVVEIFFVLGKNLTYVDLFDVPHARKVLFEFGRAYERLPDDPEMLTRDQQDFLDHAISGLTQEGKVICVRISLFADMIKGMPWNTSTLKKVGGAEGMGVAFLELTFSANSAPAAYRHHQKAARAVLDSLLPGAGTDIRGHMQSHDELLKVSGYPRNSRKFNELIQILEGEVRLITATDPEILESPQYVSANSVETRYYQLTHDYLVPTLRTWLDNKQSLIERLCRWCKHPDRIYQTGGLTVFVAFAFTVFHLSVLFAHSKPGLLPGFAPSTGVATAILLWLTVFDVPYLWLGFELMRKKSAAVYKLMALDILCLTHAVFIFIQPHLYVRLFGASETVVDVRARYFIILLVLVYLLVFHAIAIVATRSQRILHEKRISCS